MANTIRPKSHTPLLDGTLKNLFFPPERTEYRYFQHAGQFPFAASDYLAKASWAADAAMLSYARYGWRKMSDDDLIREMAAGGLSLRNKIGDWNALGTQGFFAVGNGFAVLAFRGTEPEDPVDIAVDATLVGPGLIAALAGDAACWVHPGFENALDVVWNHAHGLLTEYRAEHPDGEICLTGHSLGGALAVLAYSRFPDQNTACFTFGCPRVGASVFCQKVATNPGKGHFRFVNEEDTVTHVPPEGTLYHHAPASCNRFRADGQLELCASAGDLGALEAMARFSGVVKTMRNLGPALRAPVADGGDAALRAFLSQPAAGGVVDHSPARYCMRLRDLIV